MFHRFLPTLGLLIGLVGCTTAPTLEGTRCREPDRPCGDELGCVGGVCLALRGEPIECQNDEECVAGDPRRPYCVGTNDDDPASPESYRDNFCGGCGHDGHCEEAVCVKAGHFCIGCTTHSHCATGLCVANICRSCKGDAQCPMGSCVDGRCVSCTTHEECASNWCDDGVCRSCGSGADCCAADGRTCGDWSCVDRVCRAEGAKR